jgi:uncharacterized membrane protein
MKVLLLYLQSAFYIIAGLNHFFNPKFYERIMPAYLPAHSTLIYVSGFAEIILGALLIPEFTRASAAWGIIILLIAIFPANIQMMINYKTANDPLFWLTIARLPLQLLFIYWAYVYTRPA